jgi:hypothetical protein
MSMSQALTAPALRSHAMAASVARCIPADLRIPPLPRARTAPLAPREAWWREAMRWSLIGLTTSWAAGEVTLLLLG